MMSRLELSIAWRYMRSRKGSRLLSFISMIAMLGIIVGVSALIVIIGVMNGLQHDLREKILIGSPDIRVLSFGSDLKVTDWREVLGKVTRHPGVVSAAPFVQTEAGMNAGHDYAAGVYVVGIPPEQRGRTEVTSVRRHAINGDFRFASSDGQRRGAVLGKLLAARFNAWPGDTVTLVAISGSTVNAVTGTIVPRVHQFEVTGIVETGMYEYDNNYVYIDLDVARDFAGLGDAVTGLEVRTQDRWQAERVAGELSTALGYPYRTEPWQEQNKSLFQALKLEKLAMGVVLLLIVLVAAFNIVSTLTMVVKDKTREIGILRAMGMPARSVRRVFFAQGLVIGVIGTGIGVALGFGAAQLIHKYELIPLDPSIYFIDHLPVMTSPADLIWIVLASLGIAAIATLYPAIQAAKLYPIDAIRHE